MMMDCKIALLFLACLLLALSVLGEESNGDIASPEDLLWYAKKRDTRETGSFSAGLVHVLRLGPGEDLQQSLYRFARVRNIKAASIVSCVGSLQKTNIRYANDEAGTALTGHFEIVSLVGNVDLQPALGSKGAGHIHIALADEKGAGLGGHLLEGNEVYTTAELTLLEIDGALFKRVPDVGPGGSGYSELKVFNINA